MRIVVHPFLRLDIRAREEQLEDLFDVLMTTFTDPEHCNRFVAVGEKLKKSALRSGAV